MKAYIIARVPVAIDAATRTPIRRASFGTALTIVDEADGFAEAKAKVGALSFGDSKNHYYGFELRLLGAPDEKSATIVAPKPPKAKLRVVSEAKKEKKA